MANIINVIVKDAETPEDDIIVPDTGWYTSSIERHDTEANFVAPFIGIGVISFALLLILMFAKRKWKRISHFGALSILAILGIGVSIYGVIANSRVSATDNLISITSSDTTITVVREEGAEATYGVATATIELNETTALGYNIFAYTPDGNVLHADTGDGVINPVDTNNSALSNNTWGIALTDQTNVKAEDTVWNIIDDESNPLLVASFDESTTASTTVTLRYGVLVDSSLPVGVYSANIEYKAYQRAYTITFDPGEGQITTPTKPVIIGEQIGELPVPTRTNYNFLGWFTEDDQQINETTVPDGNTTYHAKWDRITYNITFDPGEGTITSGDASKTVQAGEPLGTLPEATRENYTFTGWWTAAEGGTRVTTATEPTESTTYFAHWDRIEYTITFDLNGGNINGDTTNPTATVYAGETLGSLPQGPTKEDHTFAGWWTEETNGTEVTTETVPESTTTYYAHWTEALTPCNPNATTIGTGNNTDAVCMQDVASMSKTTLASAINNMTAETNYTLRDSRDDQDYTVAKLKDDKIWMTKNMNLPGETKLYSDDSDVPSGYNKGEGASDNPYFTLPTSSTTGFDDDTKAFVYNTDNQTNTCTEPGCYSYYSWLAATAGGKDASGNAVADYHNAPYSICPAGWGLPTATTSNAPAQTSPNWKTGDFYKLATAYGANLEDNSYDNSSATGGNFVTNAGPTSALPKFLLGGIYGSSAFRNGGSRGYYWSATSTFSSTAYNLDFYSSAVISAGYNTRGCGFSVRCMLRMPTNTITFNANGGTIDGDNTITHKVDVGSTLGTLPEPTRTGYDFTGWFTEETEGTQITAETKPDGDTTYYAHWTLSNPVVTFNTDGGSNVPAQTLTPGEKAIRPTTNPTKSGYNFVDWYTNDSYSTLFDFDTPINTNTTIYARFVENRYIAEMNGDVYETIQSAVDIAPSNQTTIRLLADTSEKVTIGSGQDIILDLNSKTLSYPGSGENVIINKGTLTLENGTVASTGGKGMINNNAGATLTTRNVNLAITTTTPKQAIYNNGGTAYILEGTNIETQSSSAGAIDNHGGTMVIENARIVSTGARQGVYNDNNGSLEIRGANTYISAKPDVGSTNRAAVQSVNGSLVITGGTIVSKDYAVTVQDGSFRLGTQDDAYNDENPEIRGGKYGIQSSVNYSVYDGIIEGKTAAVNDETKITGKETNYGKVNGTKDIDGTTYQTIYYETETEYTITFNLNGGNINGSTTNPTATVQVGDTLGSLPTEPTRTNYTFDGWYTELNGGTKITENTRPTESRSYFAHWNRIEYTITYNLNGGNIGGSTTNPTATVYAGETLGTLPTEPTRTNYTFDGWFTAETGGDEVTTGTIPTGTTTYFAHWTLVAVTFDDAYAAAGKTRDVTSGKYILQDMDINICNAVSKSSESDYSDTQETQLVDLRDGKVYWVAKLLDGKCWMTQNLDYDLDSNTALVHASSDIGWGSDTTTMSWTPERSTIPASGISSDGTISEWDNAYNEPYSVDMGDWYWTDTWYKDDCTHNPYCDYLSGNENGKFSTSPYIGNGEHGHVGNYYNWPAAIASNNSRNYNTITVEDITGNPQNSVCPAGWRLPTISRDSDVDGSTNEFKRLTTLYGNTTSNDKAITAAPLWFIRGGSFEGRMNNPGNLGVYWSSTVVYSFSAFPMYFLYNGFVVEYSYGTFHGMPVRCVARNTSPTNLITFNANGGVVEGGSTTTRRITENQAIGTLPEATRNGYVFEGWYTQTDGGEEVNDQIVPAGAITYYAHWSVAPTTFDDAYAAAGKSRDATSGKYIIQDMNKNICDAVSISTKSGYSDTQETQLVDIRDGKTYWVAKLLDGHCWMTQNLDLDLEATATNVEPLTSENTDLNTYGSNGYDTSNGYSQDANGVITWTPERNTIPTSSISSTGSISGWAYDYNSPYSIDTGDWYWIGNWKNNGTDTWYSSTTNNYLNTDGSGASDKFSTSPYTGNGTHGHVGNYYNWSATIASNNSSSYNASTLADITTNPQNSICPSGWRLPTISNQGNVDGSTNEFRRLVTLYGNTTSNDKAFTTSPLWFVRGGYINSTSRLSYSSYYGDYWSSTVYSSSNAYGLYFSSSYVNSVGGSYRYDGWSVRCVARDMSPTNLITFNANGGVVEGGGTTTRRITDGQALGTLPEATRDGYVFEGWYTQMDGGTKATEQTVPSGTITYYAHWSVAPTTFDDAYAAAGKSRDATSGKYTLQDMSGAICDAVSVSKENDYSDTQETQLVDIRDGKTYWVAKLLDGHCWMTQNLDLDLEAMPDHVLALTSENTDLNEFGSNRYDTGNGYSKDANDVITWTPENAIIPTSSISSTGKIPYSSTDGNYEPYSVDTGDWYWIGNWKNNGTDTWYSSGSNNYLDIDNSGAGDKFSTTEYTGNGKHGHVGNYYNWTAAIASNNSITYNASTLADITGNPQNSICPVGWRLPTVSNASDTDGSTNEFTRLVTLYSNTTSNDKALTASPLWFVRGGVVNNRKLESPGFSGSYLSSTVFPDADALLLTFYPTTVYSANKSSRYIMRSVRCVARVSTNAITFDANGGLVENKSSIVRNVGEGGVLGTLPEATRDGYTLDGWYTEMEGGTKVTSQTVPTGAITFYAHWEDATTFDEAYAAVGKSKDITSDKYKIHEMTTSICESVTTGQTGELVDVRDDMVYHVGKLADDRCWLLDNLALDAVVAKANLTPENTNATQAAIDNFITDSGTAPQAGWATTAVSYETSSNVLDQPRISVASKTVVPSDALSTDGGWKVGVYYNYCAASIGTFCYARGSGVDTDTASAVDAKNDICPAGWRMPTGYNYDATTRPDGGEYKALYNAYPAISGGDIIRKAFRLPLSGLFYRGNSTYQGSSAEVWSSTLQSDNDMYKLSAFTYGVSTQSFSDRSYGLSVRCIAK